MSTGCSDPSAGPCERVFTLVRELHGGPITCQLQAADRQLTLTEAEAIELGFRPDCYTTLKTRLGFAADDDLCAEASIASGPCSACETAVGWGGYRSVAGPVAVALGITALAVLRARRRRR